MTFGFISSQTATILFCTPALLTPVAQNWEHRKEIDAAFAATCRCNKPIYYEHYSDADEAFARETQLKKWSRAKKIALIDRLNPSWLDLRDHLLEDGEQ